MNSSVRDYMITRDSVALDKMDAAQNQLLNLTREASSMVHSDDNKRLLQYMEGNLQKNGTNQSGICPFSAGVSRTIVALRDRELFFHLAVISGRIVTNLLHFNKVKWRKQV